ncbi:MAG: VCBS repeat-containing protein [Cyclobacteriaceae bacterium]
MKRTHYIRKIIRITCPLALFLVSFLVFDLLAQGQGFRSIPSSQSGITFENTIEEDSKRNIIVYQGFYDGGGVALADFNNDGLLDVFFTGNMVQNRLYLNNGSLRFEDVTDSAGLTKVGLGWYTGVTLVDINNDGWMDMYVCKSGRLTPRNRKNLLYVNNRDMTFTEKATEYGLDYAGYSTQATFFDFDLDGDLDMFQANYGTIDNTVNEDDIKGLRASGDLFKGDKLFENRGGRFVDITDFSGIIDHAHGFAHSAGVGDFNNDGLSDIFVSNDFTEHDFLYINNGDKTFTESAKKFFKHLSNYSMGNDVADFNNDGQMDIVVVDMVAEDNKRQKENMGGMQRNEFMKLLDIGYHYQYMFNMLHMNTGNSSFSDIAHLAGISNTDWSWAPLFADFDNDGWKDLYITNGLKRDARNQDARYVFVNLLKKADSEGRSALTEEEWMKALDAMPSEKLKNYMYRNTGNLGFEKKMDEWGLGIESFSNGAAYGDLDNDGDLDLIVNNINAPAFVFENLIDKEQAYVDFELEGPENNRDGLGATVKIWDNGNLQVQQQQFNHGFRSAMSGPIHFGVGTAKNIDSAQVVWPGGVVQMLYKISTDQKIVLKYDNAQSPKKNLAKTKIFKEVKGHVSPAYQHQENEFDDFDREVLLPHTMSAFGPNISVGDATGDGLEDFYVGGALGYAGVLYVQQKGGTFTKTNQQAFEADKQSEDAGSLFFDFDNDGDNDLLVVSGGNERESGSFHYLDRLYTNDGIGNFEKSGYLPEVSLSGSVVRAADFDSDGDKDLFIGGRQMPGAYPNPASSLILENVKGSFKDVTVKVAPELGDIGMVTSAQWADVDGDKDVDLILAGEWMPITIFRNGKGRFKKWERSSLQNTAGWWFSLEAADMDNDGDIDLFAGNVGKNYKYKASEEHPFEVYSKDFDANGKNDIVLAYYDRDVLYPLRGKSCSTEQIPSLKERFPTYQSFAMADLSDVYGESDLKSSLNLKVHTFASVYVENMGNGNFKIHELPDYAQLSSINGITLLDVDGDGLKDAVVAGNMYGSEVETVRNDAGHGMYLRNTKNRFEVVPFLQSGLFLDGDVKSLKMIKTSNGTVLLAGKNRGTLQLVEILD